MNRKMTGRKLIRLSQIKEKVATENLEETDWVTFGVILRKVTPQSANSVSYFTDSSAVPAQANSGVSQPSSGACQSSSSNNF